MRDRARKGGKWEIKNRAGRRKVGNEGLSRGGRKIRNEGQSMEGLKMWNEG